MSDFQSIENQTFFCIWIKNLDQFGSDLDHDFFKNQQVNNAANCH